MWYIYTTEYYSDIRKVEIVPFETKMDGPWEYYANQNKSEKAKNHMISLVCEIHNWNSDNTMVVTRGKRVEGSEGGQIHGDRRWFAFGRHTVQYTDHVS